MTTDTRQAVQDRRAEYAFHDDLVYLHEAQRGLTRATVEEISAIKGMQEEGAGFAGFANAGAASVKTAQRKGEQLSPFR